MESIDIVLDIDDTLVFIDFDNSPDFFVLNPKLNTQIPYSTTHGAIEFLQALASIPDVRISFFSCGEKWRNESLVPQMILKAAPNALSHTIFGSFLRAVGLFQLTLPSKFRYELLSKEKVNYSGRKDLRKVRKGIQLDRTILIDDRDTSYQGQEKNLLKLQSGGCRTRKATCIKTCKINDLVQDSPEKGNLPCFDEYFKVQNNLFRALGLILLTIRTFNEHKDGNSSSLIDCLSTMQRKYESNCYEKVNRWQVEGLYQLGLTKMREFNQYIDFKV